MALFSGNVFSKALRMETQLWVSLPQDGRHYKKRGPPKALVLLHGISDNAAGWVRHSLVDTLAEKYGTAVIMPEVQRSFYQDMALGPAYCTYIAEELPALCKAMFALSPRREDWTVAGLSMGGYGALRVALAGRDTFGCCGAFSAVCDLAQMIHEPQRFAGVGDLGYRLVEEFTACFGQGAPLPAKANLFNLAGQNTLDAKSTAFYLCCGTGDFLLSQNRRFQKYLQDLGVPAVYEEWPGGHDWVFWNQALEKLLAFGVKRARNPAEQAE